MAQRNDPSSLSFGARLRRVEAEAATSKRKVKDLEQNSLDAEQKADANERRRMKRQENSRASAMLATGTASLAELQGVDQTLLPTAQRHLIQQEIISKQFAEVMPSPIQLSPEAMVRIRNWQMEAPQIDGAPFFQQNNSAPEPEADPMTQLARDYYQRRRNAAADNERDKLKPHGNYEQKLKSKAKAEAEYRRKNGKDLSNPFSQALD